MLRAKVGFPVAGGHCFRAYLTGDQLSEFATNPVFQPSVHRLGIELALISVAYGISMRCNMFFDI
jgi:hypothetical protein